MLYIKGVYGYLYLPAGTKTVGDSLTANVLVDNYFPFIVFIVLSMFTSYGIYSVIWMLITEVFPSKYVFISTAGITAHL